MFKKKDNETTARTKSAKADVDEADHAYEDSWYRSLKALAEARQADDDEKTVEEEAVEEEATEEEAVEEEAVEEEATEE
jgi:hypothetical protein